MKDIKHGDVVIDGQTIHCGSYPQEPAQAETIKSNIQPQNNIPPYKLAYMMKITYQIVDKLANVPMFMMTYSDIEFVLETIMDAVKKAKAVRG